MNAASTMIEQLGVVCTGNVRVTEGSQKMGEVVYAGQMNLLQSSNDEAADYAQQDEAICSC